MDLQGKTVGFALTGSHCTYDEVRPVMKKLLEMDVRVIPILSHTVMSTSTRFAEADQWVEEIEKLTGETAIKSIVEAEPLGPSKLVDVLLIAPCTGGSISRLANAITDSPVLMAAKATMRNDRPVVLAISTNDGLGLNMANIAKLMASKNIFMVPFGQDDPFKKMNSLVACMDRVIPTLEMALEKKQLQPVLVERYKN